ncbi:MAG TPA: GGDEF domain-containing protein [Candidatus Hydrogenedentes bacterium]|nr:GGDEF domain-containing protein [Candidatus Hydrogenedentota bacterium]
MTEIAKKNEDTGDLAPDATVIAGFASGQSVTAAARASLVVLAGAEIGREIEVHGRGQILGRSPLAHVTINAPSVSRQHVRIDRVEEDAVVFFELTDLGSSNGTLVNGARADKVRLKNGDRIGVGEVLLKFILQDEVDQQFHQEVHRLIHYDRLTGLLTMESFRSHLDRHLQTSGPDRPFSLAMTDLDGLKKVNDTHGHLAGRMVVQEMGAMMRASIREGDLAGLYGGDEAIVLYPATALDAACAVAEQLRRTIEAREFEHHGRSFRVTISQGLAEYPRHGRTAQELIAAADRALYAAKAAGRNCVRTADECEMRA